MYSCPQATLPWKIFFFWSLIYYVKNWHVQKDFHARSSQQQTETKETSDTRVLPKHVFECVFAIKAMASRFLTTVQWGQTWGSSILQARTRLELLEQHGGHDCTSKSLHKVNVCRQKKNTQFCKDNNWRWLRDSSFVVRYKLQQTLRKYSTYIHIILNLYVFTPWCHIVVWWFGVKNFSSHTKKGY